MGVQPYRLKVHASELAYRDVDATRHLFPTIRELSFIEFCGKGWGESLGETLKKVFVFIRYGIIRNHDIKTLLHDFSKINKFGNKITIVRNLGTQEIIFRNALLFFQRIEIRFDIHLARLNDNLDRIFQTVQECHIRLDDRLLFIFRLQRKINARDKQYGSDGAVF